MYAHLRVSMRQLESIPAYPRKMKPFSFILIVCYLCLQSNRVQAACDPDISYIAQHLRVNYTVLHNPTGINPTDPIWFNVSLTLHNDGDADITRGNWSIYFSHIRLIEPALIRPDGFLVPNIGLKINHINGDLHRISPLGSFRGIPARDFIDIRFQASDWMVSRTDVMPNWYVVSDDESQSPQIIVSTAGESLNFVSDFDSPERWKRLDRDLFNPYTPEKRLSTDEVPKVESADRRVIPTPLEMNIDWTRRVNVLSHGWTIFGSSLLEKEISYLSDKTGLAFSLSTSSPCNHYIMLENTTSISPFTANESYEIKISKDPQTILVSGATRAGVFYGIQTLLSLLENKDYPGEVGEGVIRDSPRFEHRGMHVDVGRNFHTVKDLEKIMEVMSWYKMNKLHLHLTDDEGWRLEIPEVPELTEVGARRCHDLTETECIVPQLGSGPTMSNYGTGFYTAAQYRGLLRYASDRHIKVIPEFGLVAHAHAAIKSMEARYHRYKDTDPTKAEEFLLRERNDTSQYLSIQYYTDNAVNPCIESTYHFIDVLIKSVQNMHRDIQPLEVIHFGGDEAPHNAYANSTSCAPILANGTDLKFHFVQRASEIAASLDVDISMWEDALHNHGAPMNRSLFHTKNVYTNIWNNVWEWGAGGNAYQFANSDYKVILSHATHLYFDFPYEPDPEERGYYWATRIVPTKKTFGYVPDNVYMNIDLDVGRFGDSLNATKVCANCPELLEEKRPNIIGIQGQLWSETIRTSEQVEYMIFPRLLALAERAWHKSPWEDETDLKNLKQGLDNEWVQFANTLGSKELRRLDKLGVKYRVPIAGARVNNETGVLEWTASFPGLPASYTTSLEANNWTDLSHSNSVVVGDKDVYVKIGSADSSRFSRIVKPTPGSAPTRPTTRPDVSGSSRISHVLSMIISSFVFLLI